MDLDFAKASPDRGDQTGKKASHQFGDEVSQGEGEDRQGGSEERERGGTQEGKIEDRSRERSAGEEGSQGLTSMLVIQGGGRERKRSTISVSRISSFIISPICRIVFSCVLFLYNDCKPQS